MTDATLTDSYGGRFLDELCRLAKSTCGLTYADTMRVRTMERDQLLLVLAQHYDLDALLRLNSGSPEEFARAIVDKGRRKAPEGTALELVLTLLSPVSPV